MFRSNHSVYIYSVVGRPMLRAWAKLKSRTFVCRHARVALKFRARDARDWRIILLCTRVGPLSRSCSRPRPSIVRDLRSCAGRRSHAPFYSVDPFNLPTPIVFSCRYLGPPQPYKAPLSRSEVPIKVSPLCISIPCEMRLSFSFFYVLAVFLASAPEDVVARGTGRRVARNPAAVRGARKATMLKSTYSRTMAVR